MKNPLHYQISEYDCGPTSMLNAIIYLFDRDEIPPEVNPKYHALLSGLLQQRRHSGKKRYIQGGHDVSFQLAE